MQSTVSKLDAAKHLVDAALGALLDRNDPLTAIVIAGAAEDIFQGMLERDQRGPESARHELIPVLRAFLAREDPDSPTLDDKTGHTAIRGTFNWLRHNDRPDDPQDRTLDFELEAAAIIERALVNADRACGYQHPRHHEVVRRGMSRAEERKGPQR